MITCGLTTERVDRLREELPNVMRPDPGRHGPNDCDRLVAAAGPVDILCNRAGGTYGAGVIINLDPENSIGEYFRGNVQGAYRGARSIRQSRLRLRF